MNYLYNGVELPALPEWDKEKYPYALIFEYTGAADCFGFYASSEKIQYSGNGNSPTLEYPVRHGRAICECYYGDKEWGEISEGNGGAGIGIKAEQAVWSNFNIYTEDGTLYLAASDPIPVGSAPDIEPKTFMNGWDIGQFVRAML
jgi:hypothetical protein